MKKYICTQLFKVKQAWLLCQTCCIVIIILLPDDDGTVTETRCYNKAFKIWFRVIFIILI